MRQLTTTLLATLVLTALLGGTAQAQDGFDLPIGQPVAQEAIDSDVEEQTDETVEEEPPSFYDEEVPTDESIVYVIDRSGSMTLSVGNYTGPDGSVLSGASRLDVAKAELRYSIGNLSSDFRFNVVFYGSCISQWRSETVRATEAAKQEAFAYIAEIRAGGWTNTAGGAMRGLLDQEELTVVLLSDGSPNFLDCAETTIGSSETHRRLIREANTHDARVNAFAIDPSVSARSFMQGVARDNHGMYVEIN